MEWDLLISPIFGGLIGYGTNYIAIKMLFRPHKAKYIGKMKIPFTPGLIPKEKATLAKQMGEITEDYLLTEDMLVDTLTNDQAKEVFMQLMNGIPSYMEKSDQRISQVAKYILGNDTQASIRTITDQLALEIITLLRTKPVMDKVIAYISDEIIHILKQNLLNGLTEHSVTGLLEEFIRETIEGEKAKQHIEASLDELERKGYMLLQEHASAIGKGILSAIAKAEEADKIKQTLQHWIDENFNSMVSMFINIDKIYDGIIDFAGEALDDPERSAKFGDLLCLVMKNLLGEESTEFDYKDQVITLIKNQINNENIKIIIQLITEELSKKEEQNKAQIKKWLENKWDTYLNTEALLELIQKILESFVKFIGDTSLTNLSMMIPDESKGRINEMAFNSYTKIVKRNSKSVADIMDISNLVENKINEFSSEEAESVILSVVKKQLRGITWIGALLGTLIGILSNFMR